ncbi:Metallo-beta-lactamase family protein [Candidatus Arthromitus sp. SFB-2]|nr:Metallo-beta-lactamase family protein [Candidatus Arthromitus sp. SFB-2]
MYNIKDSDVILIESNYNEDMLRLSNYPYFLKERILSDHGHLSNEECALTIVKLAEISYKRVILGHLSITSNFPELAYKTSEKIILNHGMKIGKDLKLTIAHRSLPSNYMRF